MKASCKYKTLFYGCKINFPGNLTRKIIIKLFSDRSNTTSKLKKMSIHDPIKVWQLVLAQDNIHTLPTGT